MEATPLFVDKKEMVLAAAILVFAFLLSLGFEFYKYKNLTSRPLHVAYAKVLNHYQKHKTNGKAYDVFKLKTHGGYTFYTVSWKKRKIATDANVLVKFKTDKISFLDYLKNFFTVNIFIRDLSTKRVTKLDEIKTYIKNQHKFGDLKEIFSALFFATNITKNTRAKIQKLGISHLVAISGFHLGLISAILYFILGPIYRFFQDRFFPYRNSKADLAFVIFSLLFFYMYIIDFSPSFLRSFVLSLFGFFLFSKNIKIISFATLLLSVSFILILFPRLLFSISFWFSVSGVFYIFLFLKHFSNLNKIWIFILLNFWVFAMMMPVVHYIFKVFTPLQLYSPFLSMLFVVFYPLELFLHVVNHGGLLDVWLEKLLNMSTASYALTTPLWFLITYLGLSLVSVFSRWLALFVFLLSFAVFFV